MTLTELNSAEAWTAIFTAVLSLITSVLAFATWRLYVATVTLSADAKTASEKQFEQTKESLRIAQASAEAAKASADALPTLERAHVHYNGKMTSSISTDKNQASFVNINMENFGRTPAILLVARGDLVYVRDGGIPPRTVSTIKKMQAGQMLASRDTFPLHASKTFSGEEAQLAAEGTGKLFFWGQLSFEDIFGRPHETAICLARNEQGGWDRAGGPEYNYQI